jgi:hypothetical protein
MDPGSGYRLFFGVFFLRILVLFLLIKLVPETIRSKKKVRFIFHPSSTGTVGSGIRCFLSGIREEKFRDPDPG